MAHELPDLSYGVDALAPHIDQRTMEIHHGKHHAIYVTKLNGCARRAPGPAREECRGANRQPGRSPGRGRDGGSQQRRGHANHTMFWQIMGPNAGGAPTGAVRSRCGRAIRKRVGVALQGRRHARD